MTLEKNFIRISSHILCFILIVRHSGYYISSTTIFEFGFKQPLIDIFLIPITAGFGAFFIWKRFKQFKITFKQTIKLLIVISIILIFNFIVKKYDILSFFLYKVSDYELRRPSLFIIIPIFLALVVASLKFNYNWVIIYTLVCISWISENFILHYTSVILSVSYLSSSIFEKFSIGIFILIYVLIVIYINFFEIDRINIFLEIIFVFCFLKILFKLSEYLGKFFTINISMSVLIFYLLQAIIFNIFNMIELSNNRILSVIIVYILCLAGMTILKRFKLE